MTLRDPSEAALDLNQLGMGGHSNGAMAGARACSTEPRCKAFLGFEGTQAREIRTRGVGKPFGLLISEESLGFDREGVYRQLAGTTHATFVVYRVSGAGHNSITDLVLTTPESFKYEMSAQRGIEIGIAVGTAFFDCYLRGSKCVEDVGTCRRSRSRKRRDLDTPSSSPHAS